MLIALGSPVNKETAPELINYMSQFNLNVADDIDDIEEYYALTDETAFAVVSIDVARDLATFAVIGSDQFHAHWEVLVAPMSGPFYQIKKI